MMSKKIDYERYFKYDYNNLSAIMHYIIESGGDQIYLSQLKNELNKIFNKNKCLEVIYTKNTDKLFFGMSILPDITNKNMSNILLNDKQEKESIKEYYIEIDSKLTNPILEFTGMHLTAILLHEIGHIVINDMALKDYRDAIDIYCSNNRFILDKDKSVDAMSLFVFAAFDSIRKIHSFFYVGAEEIYSDNFSYMCGFGIYLQQAYEIILKKGILINKEIRNKLLVLQWVLGIYKEFYSKNRLFILRKLNSCKSLSPSILEKRLVDITISRLDLPINIVNSLSESVILEFNRNNIFDKIARSGLRGMENELYELKIQAKSTNDRDDCLYVLRMINTRLGIVDEYLESHKDELSDDELQRWINLYQSFSLLREELTSKKVFGTKIYGLFTDYTKLPPSYISNLDNTNIDY